MTHDDGYDAGQRRLLRIPEVAALLDVSEQRAYERPGQARIDVERIALAFTIWQHHYGV